MAYEWDSKVVAGNTKFALDLYQELKENEGNLFFSPYSVSTALAMTYAGARGNTEMQMAETLRFSLLQDALHPAFSRLEARLMAVQAQGRIQLRVANSLWPQVGYALLEEFISLTEKYYGAVINPVEYGIPEAARKEINDWVEEKTEEKIKDLIPPPLINQLTTLVLVNAIYFKGNWANQFDPELTKDATFWVSADEGIKVPMMKLKGEFMYSETDHLQLLEFPYVGEDLAMIVLLPKEIDGLERIEKDLTIENLENWTIGLWETEVVVSLPKFNMSGKFMLGGTLASMGMPDAFGGDADFSGMDGTETMAISEVVHKAFIEVNEEGTEAAAATAVVMARSIPPPPPIFTASHPFVFLIRDTGSGSILFLGRLANPVEKDA
jgi:serpin B